MAENLLSQIPEVELQRILKSRTNQFYGPFDDIKVNGQIVNNLFIRKKKGKIQITDQVPYKVSGMVIDPVNRNRLANRKATSEMYIPTAGGAALLTVQYPYKLNIKGKVEKSELSKIKEKEFTQFERVNDVKEIQKNLSKIFNILDRKERKVFSDKIRDRMKELVEVHNLEKAKGTKKSMVTISEDTAKNMKSIIEKENSLEKPKEIKNEKVNKKRKDLGQALPSNVSKGINL